MAINVKITSEIGEILLKEDKDSQGVTGIEFIFDSADGVKDKSFEATAGLKLLGEISDRNSKDTLELGKWALCVTGEGIYRKVNVMITNNSEEVIREYNFSNMFVVDYVEKLDGQGKGTYTIELRQRAKDTNIEIFA